jgi:carbamoyltransferase
VWHVETEAAAKSSISQEDNPVNATIGVSALYHDSAAAAVVGGELIAAAQEERFTRRKHDPRFPLNALNYCIGQVGGPDKIDAIAFYEDPVLSFDRVVKNTIDLAPATEEIWPAASTSQLCNKVGLVERLATIAPKASENIFIVDHHISHLAAAFYPSPFKNAAVVVADGVGEWATTTIADAEDRQIVPLAQINYPHSLGLFYSAFTYHCGFKVNSGEYKLMGLAPYGEPRFVQKILDHLIDLHADGSFSLYTEYFGFLTSELATTAKFEQLFESPRRQPESPLTPLYMDIAASAQAVIDEAMLRICRKALADTDRRHLCLSGGVALNCVTNGKLLRQLQGLEGIWIQPAAGDAGGAVGAALHVTHKYFEYPRRANTREIDSQKGSFLGPEFSMTEVEGALRRAGLAWQTVEDASEYVDRVAAALKDGLIVGRFDGRMEFGPRALGNRSILADARRPDAQRHINLRIKRRESWRPFAPAVLAHKASDYFELNHESPYMLLVADVRERLRTPVDWSGFRSGDSDMMKILNQQRSSLPSITHVDYSARVQTVDAARNPAFHQLLNRFYAVTGCPVLINTSFNERGEPIVCSPDDAVRCFLNTGIDLLAIGKFLVFKTEQSNEIKSREGSVRYEPD